MRWFTFLLSLLVTLALAAALLMPVLPSPFTLGSFFSPFEGFWQNAVPLDQQQASQMTFEGLTEPVRVVTDKRGVHHIFAQSDKDLYYTQGFLTAQERLWQMEFQVRAASGSLSEILGKGAGDRYLTYDRTQRRRGMIWAAERKLTVMQQDPLTYGAIEAYAAGVNAYIESLDPKDYPLEYKLLGYEPEPWTPLKTSLFTMMLSNMLGGKDRVLTRTKALQTLGPIATNSLYPEVAVPARQKPIVPAYTRFPKREAIPAPPAPTAYRPDSMLIASHIELAHDQDKQWASNNWVVGPQKSATGYPILANDPHLGLNLPAIWYEIQLSSPSHNVYGFSMPGAPGVVIGFNDSIAWGDTNGSREVIDYYTITYRSGQKKEYQYDGQWLPVQVRVEEIKVKGEAPYYDTVHYTHHGPVLYDEAFGREAKPLAMRWMAHEPSNEIGSLLRFNRADNYEDYVGAMESFGCPAQNFVFAAANGDIALWEPGTMVNRWPGQGRYVLDGTRKDHTWQSFVPKDQWPHVLNPPEGFISSTNQRPTSTAYPYYYIGLYNFYRSQRIYELLTSKDTFTVQDMMDYQLDAYNKVAEDILPTLLAEVDSTALSGSLATYHQLMTKWDYVSAADVVAPTLFELWWEGLKDLVFEDELKPAKLAMPMDVTAVRLIKDSVNLTFFRQSQTGQSFTRQALVTKAFRLAVDSLQKLEQQDWGDFKQNYINHLTRQKPLSRGPLKTSGGHNLLNAIRKADNRGNAGPSFRMVVQLGPDLQAWGVYPGGQTGHPGDPGYDAFIPSWLNGEYFPLQFWHTSTEVTPEDSTHLLIITPQPAS